MLCYTLVRYTAVRYGVV